MLKKKFPIYRQLDKMDCGPACIKMIAEYYGKTLPFSDIKKKSYLTKQGVSMAGLIAAGEDLGFKTLAVNISLEELGNKANFPCLVHFEGNHFVVVYEITNDLVFIADPAKGLYKMSQASFFSSWSNSITKTGAVLLFETTKKFYELTSRPKLRNNVLFLKDYFKPYKNLIVQLFLGVLLGNFIQLMLPFLTQGLIDYGINYQNINFVYTIVFAQIVFFLAATTTDIIRNWILLHLTERINIRLLNDFLDKLLRLPISYFQSKQTGDLMQRIYDHRRIEEFLSADTLNALFSLVNVMLFGGVLAWFNFTIFLLFLVGSTFYFVWSLFFMEKRKQLDREEFMFNSKNQSILIQLLHSINEIKLNGSENRRKNEWKKNQIHLFKTSIKNLTLQQRQSYGGMIINELKNIGIMFFAAFLVIEGSITLGTMLAIQFILGSVNNPIYSLVTFMLSLQDANLSIQRLNEIHGAIDEQKLENAENLPIRSNLSLIVENLTFRYGPPSSKPVLENINLIIPKGKVTAIVGPSGSGKSTLLKLLLGFYQPTEGAIKIGAHFLRANDLKSWRSQCGVVLQDGFIFNDSLENNITESRSNLSKNQENLNMAISIANLSELTEALPNKADTILGAEGNLLSGGEKQRVLIARAVYKQPDYLFFDEATSSLDSSNETYIMKALQDFFKNRTVVIIAHRLSTVKNADQIVFLDNGSIHEIGTHIELVNNKGAYYKMVKDQL